MIETQKSISEWSEQVFPVLEKYSQQNKLVEEVLEYINAKTDEEKVKELADIYIVASILRERFRENIGFKFFQAFYTNDMATVYSVIDEKMKINRSRVWEYKNGVYHHIKEQNNE